MNDAHLHLVVNHFPIIVPLIGALILITGLLIGSDTVKKTAFGVLILGALLTFPAMYTGEGAEEIAEKLPDVTDALIHNHEEKAEALAFVNYILGFISLIGFWAYQKQKSFARYISLVAIVIGLAGLYFAQQAGTSGGEIRHTEIRDGASLQINEEVEDDD